MTPNTDNLIQSNNMTVGQVKHIGLLQSGRIPGGVPKIPGNKTDILKDKEFVAAGYGDYKVEVHEAGVYHIAQEARAYNMSTGEKTSSPMIQKYTSENFEFMKKNNGFAGQTVVILHDPTGVNIQDVLKEHLVDFKEEGKVVALPTPPAGPSEKEQLIERAKDLGVELSPDDTILEMVGKIAGVVAQREITAHKEELAAKEQERLQAEELALAETKKREHEEFLLSLNDMTVASLTELAAQKGIDVSKAKLKSDFVETIKAALS